MTSDADAPDLATDSPFAAAEAQIAREAESDARLDAAVREAAEVAYSRPDEPLPQPNGRTVDQTIVEVQQRIERRAEPPVMPRMPLGATVEQTVEEAAKWNATSKADQRAISNAHAELKSIKDAAASYDIKIESMADVKAFKEMMGADKANGTQANGLDRDISEALSPGAPDQALPVLRETVQAIQQDPVRGTRQLLDNMNIHPLSLLSPHEQQALAGRHGGEIGAVVARNHDLFAQHGIAPAQAFEALLAAHRMFERDPAAAIYKLAELNNIDLSQLAHGDQARLGHVIEAFAAHKGSAFTNEVRSLMGDILQEDGFAGDDVPEWALLDAAFREARRRMAQHAKRSTDVKMTETLQAAARKAYRK